MHRHWTTRGLVALNACIFLALACSDEQPQGNTTESASGGSFTTSGGAGGASASGGQSGAPAGGGPGSGGTPTGLGGMAGGGPGGQSATGGADSGGQPGAGGTSSAGGGPGNSGGQPGSGGEPAGSGGSSPGSNGCGAGTWPDSDRYTVDSGGTTREYVLEVPDDYDPNHPYRLVFGWHWRGGNANDVVNGAGNASRGRYYGLLERAAGSAIFVAPEGLVDNGVTGWANPGGRDIEFLRAMLDRFNTELCIDPDRIFSTGFSYGGMMSNAVGCALGDVFRAVAPMAGSLWSGCEDGTAPVAYWGSHADPLDSVVPPNAGREARDVFLARNGCDAQTQPTEPSPCVTYQGCQAGYPVTWCEFPGDHFTPDFAPQAVWDFFAQF